MSRVDDERFIRRAIDLAQRGRGGVEPNPMVGCVIVAPDGAVIGEGFHQRFGQAHAEAAALASCRFDPRGATAYVTLEPCCHHGKKTPPCAPRLIEAGLAQVVIGCVDPNPAVAGGGVAMLRRAGIAVDSSALGDECRQLIAPFYKGVVHRRPYVTLKWAQSADGKVAGPGGRPARISNLVSSRQVHRLRSRCDAIAVGISTVLHDDPMLTVRDVANPRPLCRAVLDTRLRIPPASRLIRTARQFPTCIYCADEVAHSSAARELESQGAAVIGVETKDGRVSFDAVSADLFRRGATHVLIEPGPTLTASLLAGADVDRAWVFRSPRPIDDQTAPEAAGIDWTAVAKRRLDGDELTEYLNPRSSVFFAPAPSADLAMLDDDLAAGS